MSKYEEFKEKLEKGEFASVDKDFIEDMKAKILSHEQMKKAVLNTINMDFVSLYPSSVSGTINNQHYQNIERIEQYI